jgi:hypothetical protein
MSYECMDGTGGDGMDRMDGDPTGSGTPVLKSDSIKAMVVLLGILVIFFLLMYFLG